MFKTLVFFLLTHFSVGLLFTIALISLHEMGTSFFRLNSWLSLFFISLALLVQPFGPPRIFTLLSTPEWEPLFWRQLSYLSFGLSVLFLLFYNLIHPKGHKLLLRTALVLGLFGIGATSLVSTAELPTHGAQLALLVIQGVTSSMVLGSVLGAMITGHWYLVQHDLSLTPLLSSSKFYLFSMGVRTAAVLATLLLFQNAIPPLNLVNGMGFVSIVFWFRVGIGLVVPLIFGMMVLSSVRIRSTQSATGILYATIVLVLVGEVSAKFLSMTTGMPF